MNKRARGVITEIVESYPDGREVANSLRHGVVLELESGCEVFLSYADLVSPVRTREAFHEQTGHWIPLYSQEEHTVIVQVLFEVCGMKQVPAGPNG